MTWTIAFLLSAVFFQTAAPKPGPWQSLFDGKTMSAWRIFKTDNAPKMCDTAGAKDCWEIDNGVLWKDGHANDIASKDQFGDFELELEWKIGNAGNSGAVLPRHRRVQRRSTGAPRVPAARQRERGRQQDGQSPRRICLRPLCAPKEAARPANQWNQTRIVAKGSHVEHWLNGKKVASIRRRQCRLERRVGASKFNPEKFPNFGKAPKGYLGIQGNHPGTLALRNIRIRELQ